MAQRKPVKPPESRNILATCPKMMQIVSSANAFGENNSLILWNGIFENMASPWTVLLEP